MEGCGAGGLSGGRVEGVLEGIWTLFFEGVSSECDGACGV